MLCHAMNAYGQAKPIDKITQRMITAFEKLDTGGLYRAIGLAAANAFDPRTTAFLDVWKQKEQQFPMASRLDIMGQITDSVMDAFYIDFRKKTEKEFDKYPDLLRVYSFGMCPCLLPKVKSGFHHGQNISTILDKCEDSLLKDKPYVKKFDEAAKKSPFTKDKRLGANMTKYLLLTCYDLYKHCIDYVLHVNMEQYANITNITASYMHRFPLQLHREKKMDSLAAFFPAYKKHEQDINKVAALGNAVYMIMEGPVKASDDVLSKALVFYTVKNQATTILGQLSFTYAKSVPLKMLSYTFTPPAQIKNQANLLERIEREIDDDFDSGYKY